MYNGGMVAQLAPSRRARRTQAQRRAATRVALLDAAIDCLAEDGFAGATTRRIAERAGVTPGALQHHFATKTELLGDARRHLGDEFVRQMTADRPTAVRSSTLRAERQLDRWWELCKGPLFIALVELWVAARSDAQLRKTLLEAERDNAHLFAEGGRIVYPDLIDRPGFVELIQTARATIRGIAMLRLVNQADADAAWPVTRAHLLALSARFIADDRESR
jgi:AcrR family transcriptional regulator